MKGRFVRLDTLEPVRPEVVLWGSKGPAVRVRRSALYYFSEEGRVPYLAVSAKWAVRLVPDRRVDARIARVAYLIDRDGPFCFYCGQHCLGVPEVEHLVATSAGGPEHASNLLLACKSCNAAAGHLSGAEKVRLALRMRLGTERAAARAAERDCDNHDPRTALGAGSSGMSSPGIEALDRERRAVLRLGLITYPQYLALRRIEEYGPLGWDRGVSRIGGALARSLNRLVRSRRLTGPPYELTEDGRRLLAVIAQESAK